MKKQQEKSQTKQKVVYTYMDLIKFANNKIYSSIGPTPLSNKPSLPLFSFGTASRDSQIKKFISKEMAEIDCYGKSTPMGPNYKPTDKFKYQSSPNWRLGTQQRGSLNHLAKYEHYNRKDIDVTSDRNRRTQLPSVRIGLQSRFLNQPKRYRATPGPQYNPPQKMSFKKSPQFSLSSRRAVKGFDPLLQLNSTPNAVGPGSYFPQKAAYISKHHNAVHISVGNGPKLDEGRRTWDLNQTYDTTISYGPQFLSKKVSEPAFSIGKQKRDNVSGIFKQHMVNKPMPIRIQHPRI